jgi:hypothetical protein
MGSAGHGSKCPCCGRVRDGGYIVVGIKFPICSEGPYSCLCFQWYFKGFEFVDIIANAIDTLFKFKVIFPATVLKHIADMLTGWECLQVGSGHKLAVLRNAHMHQHAHARLSMH